MTAVLLFAKAPRAGRVKTRLAADIGEEAALRIYRAVGAGIAAQVAARYSLTVWYDPPDAEPELREWLGDHTFRPQPGGDLGERLAHAFAAHFAAGDRPVIAIGADAPEVTAQTIGEAERRLREADVVIGPAADGGYYLLGLNRFEPGLFTAVPWSTPDVWRITVARCRARHLAVSRMGELRDLDTAEDLRALGLGRP